MARSLLQHDVGACIAEGARPPGRIVEEERLLCAGNEVCARNSCRHLIAWLVARAGRSGEDGAEEVGMTEPEGEGQFSARRRTKYRAVRGWECDAELRLHPPWHVVGEEGLVRREPSRVEHGGVLVQPQGLIG